MGDGAHARVRSPRAPPEHVGHPSGAVLLLQQPPLSTATRALPMISIPALAVLSLLASGTAAKGDPLEVGRLTELEQSAGWRMLFDGKSTAGWVRYGGESFPEQGWEVADGCLHKRPGSGGGDLVFAEAVGDFELEFEWKVAPGANSGVKYRVGPADSPRSMLGPEYQVLDDVAHATEAPAHKSASLYAMYAAEGGQPATSDGFHRARIVARGNRIEHWLDGVRVVDAEVLSEDWNSRKAASKFKNAAGFGEAGKGFIGLQDHGGEVWYRDLRLRSWPLEGQAVALHSGGPISGWTEVGDAIWESGDDEIGGKTGGGGQSFLITERSFGDFVFEVELVAEKPGNSGIQVRSHRRDNGRVFGYQIEIDSSDRAWSAGLFDEARRGWLDNLKDEPAARAAFRRKEWNHYRIECIGPWIRTWINGIPAADHFDPLDLEGFIGLQVHSGNNTQMRWRGMRLVDLGTRSWERAEVSADSVGVSTAEDASIRLSPGADGAPARLVLATERRDFTLRTTFRQEGAELRVSFRGAQPELQRAHLERAVPALFVSPSGSQFVPGDEGIAQVTERGQLALAAYGRRISAFLDGKSVVDLRDAPPSKSGWIVIEAHGPPQSGVVLSNLELLGPAAR